MDPISIVSLVGTCAAIASRGVSLVESLLDLSRRFQSASRSATQLSNRLLLFNATLGQLRAYLQHETTASRRTRATLRLFLSACDDELSTIKNHVDTSLRSASSHRPSILGRARHMWNEAAVLECERKLGLQLQTLNNYIQLVQLYVTLLAPVLVKMLIRNIGTMKRQKIAS